MNDDIPPKRRPNGTFMKGHTGNSKGAPPKSRRRKLGLAGDILSDETFGPVVPPGFPPELRQEDQYAYEIFRVALTGSIRHLKIVFRHILRHDEEAIATELKAAKPTVNLIPCKEPDNINAALVLLGIARADFHMVGSTKWPGLQLWHWAAQKALGRRHGGKRLTDEQRKSIQNSIADGQQLRWSKSYDRQ